MNDLPVAAVLKIAECGHDEHWLRDMIYDDPSILARTIGVDDLQAVMKEKVQAKGGRLDLLLKDPADDSMYEVELQLGATDESHIIRTIEYWDNEKRRWPNRSHTAVLIAEEINSRFVNVVHLLSKAVPIIGIQANIVQVSNMKGLHFTKIIDSYEEPEEEADLTSGVYGRDYWLGLAKWTLDAADAMQAILQPILPGSTLSYLKNYIAISSGGTNLFWFYKRKGGKSLLNFKMSQSLQEQAAATLNARKIPYVMKPDGFRRIPVEAQMITDNRDLFAALAELVKKDWSEE